jgi:hypothetical protein
LINITNAADGCNAGNRFSLGKQLVAQMEMETGVDPFSQGETISSITTVGSICDIYQKPSPSVRLIERYPVMRSPDPL